MIAFELLDLGVLGRMWFLIINFLLYGFPLSIIIKIIIGIKQIKQEQNE